ncbi:hypothetical protein CK215_24895 [Mesorhizobium sp. WSM3864]|uniref:hypothetical protein n=1 Tax=Mesorhizobium sp. WSM3864 TaxID=2029404 RepID=UPI000BD7A3AC|nr:hypothetical protein [Mesorhizobium sp. WSM3864]PBB89852.1 hypothetical protein CK215_24895 [Mesorhizobium sp. WSM3864]
MEDLSEDENIARNAGGRSGPDMLLSFLRSIDRDVTSEMNIGHGHALPYEGRIAMAVPKAQTAQKNFLHILQ